MPIPKELDHTQVTLDMLRVIIEGGNIDTWIEDKVKSLDLTKNVRNDELIKWRDHINLEEPGMTDCQKQYHTYIGNLYKLERQKKDLQDYKKYISSDIKNYGTKEAVNSTNLHQMKALYSSQYTILVKFWIHRFRIIYYLILVCYIGLLVKNRKYKSKPHIAIAVILCAYPLVINHIMIALLEGMETIFSYTPANAYRNLYNQNINKLEKDDIYLHYTQIPL
tara:strand:- start:7623 stop:8288 length:666 start_codon:yes stop_codon:yes gene_type:complete